MIIMPPTKPRAAPTHRMTLSIPHGETYVTEVKPTGRAKGFRGWCKYCYRTHGSWWLMPDGEYPKIDGETDCRAMLCGYCEHVSLACFIDGATG